MATILDQQIVSKYLASSVTGRPGAGSLVGRLETEAERIEQSFVRDWARQGGVRLADPVIKRRGGGPLAKAARETAFRGRDLAEIMLSYDPSLPQGLIDRVSVPLSAVGKDPAVLAQQIASAVRDASRQGRVMPISRAPSGPMVMRRSWSEWFWDQADGAAEMAQEVRRRMSDAYRRGERAVTSTVMAIRDEGAEALQALTDTLKRAPHYLWSMINTLWPIGSGWNFQGAIKPNGTVAFSDAAIPFEIQAEVEVGGKATLFRKTQYAFELGVELTGAGSADVAVSVKAAELFGGKQLKGVGGLVVLIDLAGWSLSGLTSAKLAAALRCVAQGRPQQFLGLIMKAIGVSPNYLGLGVKLSAQLEDRVTGELGLDSVAQGVAQVGLRAGLSCSYESAMDDREGKVELEGSLGAFGSLKATAFGSDKKDPLVVLKSVVATVAGAWTGRLDQLLSAGIEAEGTAGLSFRYIIPKTVERHRKDGRIEVALFSGAKLGLNVLGQEAKGAAENEITLALPILEEAARRIRQGDVVGAGVAAGMVSKVKLKLQGEASFQGWIQQVKGLDVIILELIRSRLSREEQQRVQSYQASPIRAIANQAEVALTLEIECSREQLLQMLDHARALNDQVFGLVLQARPRDAFALLLDQAPGRIAMVTNLIKKTELEIRATYENNFVLNTPGSGDITGVGVAAPVAMSRVWKKEITRSARGLLPDLTRNLIAWGRS